MKSLITSFHGVTVSRAVFFLNARSVSAWIVSDTERRSSVGDMEIVKCMLGFIIFQLGIIVCELWAVIA